MTVLTLELSKLHDRYQTTVPSGMRKQLTLGEGDPALGAILGLIEADIKAHPKRLKTFDCALHERLKALVGDINVDLDEPGAQEDE